MHDVSLACPQTAEQRADTDPLLERILLAAKKADADAKWPFVLGLSVRSVLGAP